MSTRGAYGFKINKEIKMIMSPYDSYPGGLGADIIKFIQSVDLNRLTEKVKTLQSIPQSLIRKNELAEKEIWQKPEQVLQGIYTGTVQSFFDAQGFLEDYLFCEYSYLINLDTKELECYEAGDCLSIGTYPLNNLSDKTIDSMIKLIDKNAESKANLLGYPHQGPKKKKKK